KTWYLRYSSFL
ncbi:phenylalanine--tRNA ligase, alpha subunit, partial [Chlamydia psittaci 09DC80]